jgi:hypothetical protein
MVLRVLQVLQVLRVLWKARRTVVAAIILQYMWESEISCRSEGEGLVNMFKSYESIYL